MPHRSRAPLGGGAATATELSGSMQTVYRTVPPLILDRIYPAPRPNLWYEEWARLHHLDLPHLTDDALWGERRCVQRRIDYGGKRDIWGDWMRERLAQIIATIRQRQAEQRKPQPAGIFWGRPATADPGPAPQPDAVRRPRLRVREVSRG